MKNIILHLNNAFFMQIKANKLSLQAKLGKEITWEDYIKHLFGFASKGEEQIKSNVDRSVQTRFKC